MNHFVRLLVPFISLLAFSNIRSSYPGAASPGDTAVINRLLKNSLESLYHDTAEASRYAKKAISMSDRLAYHYGQLIGHTRLGDIYVQGGNYNRALDRYMIAKNIAVKYREKRGLSIVYNQLGSFYNSLQEFGEALDYFMKSLKLTSTGDFPTRCNRYLNIGVAYGWSGDYTNALKYLNKALAISQYAGIEDERTFIYLNLGNVFFELEDFGKALKYDGLALKFAQRDGNDKLRSSTYLSIARIYFEQNKPTESLRLASIAHNFAKIKGFFYTSVNSDLLISKLLLRKKDYAACERKLDTLKKMTGLSLEQKKDLLQARIDLYQGKKDYARALDASLQLSSVKDSLAVQANKKHMNLLEIRFRTQQQQEEIKALAAQNKWKTGLAYLGAFGIILCISIIALLQRQKKLKDRIHLQAREKALRDKDQLDRRNRELSANIAYTNEINKLLAELQAKLSDPAQYSDQGYMASIRKLLKYNIELNEDWNGFKYHFEEVHPDFFDKLMDIAPQLTKNELKHCAFIRMNISTKQIANLLNIHPDSVKMSRYRIRKKLSIAPDDDLATFILKL